MTPGLTHVRIVYPTSLDVVECGGFGLTGNAVHDLPEAECALCAAGICTQLISRDPLHTYSLILHGRTEPN